MAGPNTTGKPNTQDYQLGRGILYASVLDANGFPTDYRDLGNCPEFTLSVESETLEHQSSRSGLRTVDKQVELSRETSISFQLDEINHENLALFFSGAKETNANSGAVNGVTNVILDSAVDLGRWYDLHDGSADKDRIFGIDKANLTVEKDPAGTPVTLVEGTDYEVDEEFGRIFIIATATNIAAGDILGFSLAAEPGASTADEVSGLSETSPVVALKFIAENPVDNTKTEYQIHQTTLRAEGDFAGIGDDFTQLGFAGVLEENSAVADTSKFLTIRNVN